MKKTVTLFLAFGFSFAQAQISFQEVMGTPFSSISYGGIDFFDADSDGDLDVILTGTGTNALLYKNDGTGVFTQFAPSQFNSLVAFESAAIADVDNDQDMDMVMDGYDSNGALATKLFINDGIGNYSEDTSVGLNPGSFGDKGFSDIDGDGDQDFLWTGYSGGSLTYLYKNDGAGHFTEVANANLVEVSLSAVAFEDIDGDGDEDLLMAGSDPSLDAVTKLYVNDGAGNFTEVSGTPFSDVSYCALDFADVDNDNDPDVLITGQIDKPTTSDEFAKLYLNDGQGSFSEMTGTPFSPVAFGTVDFADVENDGDEDVLITGGYINSSTTPITELYVNDGSGNFTLSSVSFFGVKDSAVDFADIDGDTDLDLLMGGENNGNNIKLYKNQSTLHRLDFENKKSRFVIAPNPTNDEIFISGLENELVEKVVVFDMNGRKILENHFNSKNKHKLDLTDLKIGLYLLKIFSDEVFEVKQVIKL